MAKRKVNWSLAQSVYDKLKIMSVYNDCPMSGLIEKIVEEAYKNSCKHIERWQNNLSN